MEYYDMDIFLNGFVGILFFLVFITIFWVIPIWFGIKWAKIKGVSKLWMLFGIHPLGGWVAFLVIRFGIDPKKQCERCRESIKMEAQICRYCGNEMSQEDIQLAIQKYENRK